MIKKLIILSSILLLLTISLCSQAQTVLVKATQEEDATLNVLNALKKCRETKAKKLVFEKRTYNFKTNLATEKYVFVSNNDEGLKRFVFDLTGINNLEIDGQGSSFMFDGFVCPFLLDHSKNIILKNFSIDYKRTFHSEGKVVGSYLDSLDIAFSKEYPYQISHNKLLFTGSEVIGRDNGGEPKKVMYPFWHLLEFDAEKREPAATGYDFLNVQNMNVKELSPGVVRIYFPKVRAKLGNTLIFNAMDRLASAFTISDSEGISLLNVNIYHSGGIGVIAQRSNDILLDNVKVIAPQGRMVSTTADATHFVNCGGKITLQNCVFESMMDDATNIHGIYVKIDKIISSTEILVKLIHYQQFGFDFLKPNTKIEVTEAGSLMPYGENKVLSAVRLNKEYTRVTLAKPLLKEVKVGDVVASIDKYPEVLMKNCKVQKNRARGILLGSRGKTVIEDNYFHTHCVAINLEGDGRFWYEQAGVRDLTIRNNMFDNCNYSFMLGIGVISATSGIEESKKPVSRYNRNILIENNTFRVFNPNILSMYSVDNLTFRNNRVVPNTEYEFIEWFKNMNLKPYMITNSSNINIQE